MRKPQLSFLFIVVIVLPLYLNFPASATQSRLSAMGDLSIVIEDESNMINLWDFSGNPAGFLEDEKGSVIRGDFFWDSYRIHNLPEEDYANPWFVSMYKAKGNLYNNWISLGYRKDNTFALGLEGNYDFRKTESKHYRNERTSPRMSIVLTQRQDSLTCLGASMEYINDKGDFHYTDSEYKDKARFKDFKSEVALARKLSPDLIVGVILGYNSFKSDRETIIPNSYAIWLSGQTTAEIAGKLKLGLETTLKFKRADFKSPIDEYGDKEKESYYYASFKFRGIYKLTTKLNTGLFFSDNEPLVEFYYPVDGLFLPWSLELKGRHFGAGCSYQFGEELLVALEYHLRDSSKPDIAGEIWGYKISSLNLGAEGMLSDEFSLRGGSSERN